MAIEDAVAYTYVNVGVGADGSVVGRVVGLAAPSLIAVAYTTVNVGFESDPSPDGTAYTYVNVIE